MEFTDIIQANERYGSFVEGSVRRAKGNKKYQEELLQAWQEKLDNIRLHTLPTGLNVPIIAVPQIDHPAQIARYQGEWGFPGEFPYGLSIYPTAFLIMEGQQQHEEPTRIFAGLGSPEMTNQRFRYIVQQQESKRLSTAFDTNTLLGRGPDDPDYFCDIGEGGVSVATYEDLLKLYDGFLEEEDVSISMTINGPSLWMTAARLHAARDRGLELKKVRGTSQTDPCKEDDAQNELLFPLDKSIKLAMDMFEWCSRHVPRYYPINVSGYHIEQKGATVIQQAAFTLANAFVYVEEGLQRGMNINTIGRRLPFFFTSGLDFEYIALLSAVRRFWAVSLRDVYGADDAAQKLKAHVQTSGRSLYEREILNNITRTAMELFYALLNYPQALHSNSYDEPITTPTEEAVRIASDAQSILLEEMGGVKDMMAYLSDSSGRLIAYRLILKGILDYFQQIQQMGGTLSAKTHGFYRDEITRSSNKYEEQIHSGERRVIGVNRYSEGRLEREDLPRVEISDALKQKRAEDVRQFKKKRNPDKVKTALENLKNVAEQGGNVFEITMDIVKEVTLDEWTRALQEVYGMYRRKI